MSESLMEKISDKIHDDDSSTTSSSSDEDEVEVEDKKKFVMAEDDIAPSAAHVPPSNVVPRSEVSALSTPSGSPTMKSKIYRIFGRTQPVHKVLGGGKSADVLLWRNKKISASTLGVATVIWFFFECLEYHLLTLSCHILMIALAVLFVWSNAASFINKAPPRIPDVHIPENSLIEFAAVLRFEINRVLAVLRDIASGRNIKRFLGVILGLWIISWVGGWFNFLTLVYLVFVLLHTVPVFYEKYEDQVDAYAESLADELKKHFAGFDDKLMSKVPGGSSKGKKHA